MKRMYRVVTLMLILILLLGITVRADMIAPIYNPFFQNHNDECEIYERTHYINAPEGALAVYRKPEGREIFGTLRNGEEVYVSYTYDNGTWGMVRFDGPGGNTGGWIKMENTVLKYDGQQFLEEHNHQLYYDDGTAIQMLEGVLAPYTRDYPGAPFTFSSVKTDRLQEDNTPFEWLYEDPDGRIWGYMGRSRYGRDWICLSEPFNADLPVVEYQTLDLYPASDIEFQTESLPMWILPTCLVIGVAGLSLVLILVLKKKKSSV